MKKIGVFADGCVGLECVLFLLSNHVDDISYIVVTDSKSIVYKKLQEVSFTQDKIFFNQAIDSNKMDLVDFIFLLWWPYLVKEKVINVAKYGVINTHPSLLPHNRGKNYNFWNLVEEVPFGVSLHFVDLGVDNGDIIFQKEIHKTWEDNGESLFCKAQSEIIILFKESYKEIINFNFYRKEQDLKQGSYHNAKEMDASSEVFLEKKYTARELFNLLRARTFPPYDGCYFYENKEKYEIQIKIRKKGVKVNEIEKFEKERVKKVKRIGGDEDLRGLTKKWFESSIKAEYSYNFSWMGRPIIQYPQDIIAMQEIIWDVKPDIIIETGIAHGGSLIFSASMLMLLEGCGEIKNGKVLGIDIDIREHNKQAIEAHPMSKKITMFEGSSISNEMIEKVSEFAERGKKVLVFLDSNHTHEHVLSELKAYSSLVSVGSYCCVFDTCIEDLPKDSFPDRPWDKGDNPKTAVWEFLKENDNFMIDKYIEDKILITVAPSGYLKRIK